MPPIYIKYIIFITEIICHIRYFLFPINCILINLEKQIQTSMSVLKQKLDRAVEAFQTHNFKQALESYEDCLSFCYRTDESKGVIFNIMTTKGALLCILGDLDRAMATLNQVLRSDPNHYLALVRRSQVYKKKGKFNRALKDLDNISSYCPDNLQITAMKIEIENIRNKNKCANSSEESDSEDDEEVLLNFSNVKKIDRKSCSIMVGSQGRKSRVTISGDTAFEYETTEDGPNDKSQPSTTISKEQARQKFIKTSKEIEMDDDSKQNLKAAKITSKPNPRSKSILKNRALTSIVINDKMQIKDKYGTRDSKLIDKIKNIDGKLIGSNNSLDIGSDKGAREVQFRKSVYTEFKQGPILAEKQKQNKKSGSRKSCLKNSSILAVEHEAKPARRSKFDMMSRKSIDGIVIRNRKSMEMEAIKENHKKDEDSDGGSSYNIFGSGQQPVISPEIRQQLGLSREEPTKPKVPKQRANGGKSILKKSSAIKQPIEQTVPEKQMEQPKGPVKKAKKSVMFTKSRFAD